MTVAAKNKSLNRSRRERERYVPRPEFAFTGVLAGSIGGIVISVIIETALGQPRQIIMLIAGSIGVALGFAVEGIRYFWRTWRWKVARERPPGTVPKS
jgi:hypothetical protein